MVTSVSGWQGKCHFANERSVRGAAREVLKDNRNPRSRKLYVLVEAQMGMVAPSLGHRWVRLHSGWGPDGYG